MQHLLSEKNAKKAAILLVIVGLLWIGWPHKDQGLLLVGEMVITGILFFVGSCWIWKTYRRSTSTQQMFWLLLFCGIVTGFGGHVVFRLSLFLMDGFPLSRNWAHFFWLLQVVFYFMAVLHQMVRHINAEKLIRQLSHCLIIMAATGTIGWHFWIRPYLSSHGFGDTWETSLLMLYPITDIGTLSCLVGLLLTRGFIFTRKTSFLLLLAMTCKLIVDSFSITIETFQGNYLLHVMEILGIVSLLLFGVAGLSANNERSEPATTPPPTVSPRTIFVAGTVNIMLPYLFAMILFIAALLPIDLHGVEIGALICLLLTVIHQVITLNENQSLVKKLHVLTEELEEKVTDRTQELYIKNMELAATLEKMEYMTYHDALSGLPNKRLFEEHFSAALDRGNGRVAILILDLDRFKNINDNLGHAFGDKLLVHIATRLYELEACQTVCRMSGDEFSILLENLDETQSIFPVVKQLLQRFNQPFMLDGHEIHLTASIGIAVYPHDGTDFETLLKHAETAMFRVKRAGKNDYQFYDPTKADDARFELETAMRKALERDEFLVYYQPRVSLQHGQVVGMEALLRWQRPQHGLVPPSEFIPLAEETGLIIPLGEWVLRTACMQAKEWHDEGLPPVRVAVNLSALQFRQVDLVEMIQRILLECELHPQYLELEITESVAMQDVESAFEKLTQLKKMGVEISIDDFGTGYSSLHYLGQYPIDTLKIDRSFVSNINVNAHHAAIVAAITALGHSLQLKVLAEGIETQEQLEILRQIGCQEMQGFFYSPPVAPHHFRELLVSGKKLSFKVGD